MRGEAEKEGVSLNGNPGPPAKLPHGYRREQSPPTGPASQRGDVSEVYLG